MEVTRSKIHRLVNRFSIDFSLLGLTNGFLSQVLDYFLALTNIFGLWSSFLNP